MLIIIECKSCQKNIEVNKTNQKTSNGAFILLHSDGTRVRCGLCAPCWKHKRISYYSENKNIWRDYEKKPDGFIMRLYRNMKSRIEGIQKKKHHLYKGKSLLSKEDFYQWAKDNKAFIELFKAYVDSGFDRKLAPSVDRIDSSVGYEIGNIEFVTHSENSRRGGKSKGAPPSDRSCSEP